MSRHRFHVCAAVCGLFVMLGISGRALVARQQGKPGPQPPGDVDKKAASSRPFLLRPSLRPNSGRSQKKAIEAQAALNKMFDAYDLNPHGLPAIPDNSPPHEGAMIDYPIVIEPPDLILIEVLEALPGRPISENGWCDPTARSASVSMERCTLQG